ncbi:MAG: aminotransferase class I/II-fold pyridoxal phosphate-dependent enzyme [Acidimicrobiia bacterium]|jgi:aspartate/methionine/tyrosine aminotransferase
MVEPSRRSAIPPFYVMEVMRAAAERQAASGDVLHLEVGQPMTHAPAGALDAASRSIEADRLGYTQAAGTDELRERIARHYREQYDVDVGAHQVLVTVGASGAFLLLLLAAFDVGDRIGVTEPGYPAYRNMISALGLEPVGIRVGPDTRYVPTPEVVSGAGELAGLVVASPSNPTGTALSTGELAALARFADTGGIRLISDEIYHGITYRDRAVSVLEVTEGAVVVQSFSKYYSMTGWRLGWLVLPESLMRPVEVLAQNLFISPPAISQLAGLAALDCRDELDANVDRYARGRAVLIEGLRRAGITEIAPPDGAFYIWADVRHLADDSQELCRRWLDEIGVAATPGVDFDPAEGHHHVRFSFSEAPEVMAEAALRLQAWVASQG